MEESAFMVPAALISGGMFFACVIGVVAMFLRSKAKERIHKERMLMIEKGLEIPKELLEVKKAKRPMLSAGIFPNG